MKFKALFFSLMVASASAAPHVVDLKFEKLELRNGQKFQAGAIKSYDHANGKIVIHANRQILSVQIELLPEELAQTVISLVPEEAKQEKREQKAERKEQNRTASQRSAAANKAANDAWARNGAVAKANAEAAKQAAAKEDAVIRAKSLARERANRFYRYELKPGSGSVYIIGAGVQLDEPIEVAGWDRRYRVTGSVGLEYYDSRGRSFQILTKKFEVLVGPDSYGNVVALDFSEK